MRPFTMMWLCYSVNSFYYFSVGSVNWVISFKLDYVFDFIEGALRVIVENSCAFIFCSINEGNMR